MPTTCMAGRADTLNASDGVPTEARRDYDNDLTVDVRTVRAGCVKRQIAPQQPHSSANVNANVEKLSESKVKPTTRATSWAEMRVAQRCRSAGRSDRRSEIMAWA